MLCDLLKELRSEQGLLQKDVALAIGLSTHGYQDLEYGRLPRYDALLKIANYCNVSVDWLMGRSSQRELLP